MINPGLRAVGSMRSTMAVKVQDMALNIEQLFNYFLLSQMLNHSIRFNSVPFLALLFFLFFFFVLFPVFMRNMALG